MPGSPFWHEVQRQVRQRAPRALLVYLILETVSLAYEAVTYPERVPIALGVWVLCCVVATVPLVFIRFRPERSVEALAAAAATAGALIAAYHVATVASADWCLLVLTGLLCATSLFFPWGWRAQFAASTGAIVGYPVAVYLGMVSVNPLITGLTYLACVVGLSCYCAELNLQHLRESFHLTRAIAARETRLRSYLDQALIGIGVLTPSGTWREVNAALCRIVGFGADELIGRPWTELLPPGERGNGNALAPAVDGPSAGATVDLQLRAKGGRPVHVCIASRSFHAPDGTPEETVLMILDITERMRAQAAVETARDVAETAYQSKSEFLAHMSHELRTPMNIIFGMTEIAMDGSDSSEQREVLGRTRDAAKSLLVLVDEVLDLSRIEMGRLRLQSREFELRGWLDEVVGPMSTLACEKGLELRWSVDDHVPPCVRGDPDRMRQVLVNLVANAIKFTDRGTVAVRVGPSSRGGCGTELEFSVEDTGPGVPSPMRSRIFEPFVQGPEDPAAGTGLGLTICARIVERMGGRIWLESEEGAGSRFHFTAPSVAHVEA